MAYTTAANVKTYLGISGSGDDTLLGTLVARAQAIIDAYTGRTFEASTETRYYGIDAVEGNLLHVDKDLLTVTTLTNGNAAATTITNTQYWLWPRNRGRYRGIMLKSDYSWEQDTDYFISVAGTWGWSATVPADIAHACDRLAAYLYRQKDAQVFDVVASPETGLVTVPQGIPRDVQVILDRYLRREFA